MPEDGAVYLHRGTRAVQRMVEFAPSSGGLALWVRHLDLAAEDAPAVATDGNSIFYGPGFERLPVVEQAGLVAHEVLHIALRHPQRLLDLRQLLGDVDRELFTVCADAIVNSTLGHLNWLRLPPGAVTLDLLLGRVLAINQSVEKSLLEWDVERLYRAIDDRRQAEQGSKRQPRQGRSDGAEASAAGSRDTASRELRPEPGSSGRRHDGPSAAQTRMLGLSGLPDLLPATEAQGAPEAEAELAREWRERILRAHAGDGAHSMLRALIADLPRSRTPWEQVLRTQLARSLSTRPDLSWSRPTRSYIANQGRCGPGRRMPWEPGRSPTRAVPRLVVIVDVSGSVEDELMERFACEIEAISRRQEAGLVLVVGDDRVRHVASFEPGRSGLREVEFAGGGGTDFTPLLEEADKHRPDIAVVLTDLQGPARFHPSWPVIWAVPESQRLAVEPFGRKLVLS